MVLNYIEVIMQISSIGLVIAAAGLWAGAGVTTRPKYRDTQTLVGGTIWSQLVIPIGLMISKIVEENIHVFVEGFYLLTGILLLWITGTILIVHEVITYKRRKQRLQTHAPLERTNLQRKSLRIYYEKASYVIGVLCIIAGVVKMIELVVFVILASED